MPPYSVTPSIRLTIRKRYSNGTSPTVLARQFGISRSTVHGIARDLSRQRQVITPKTVAEIHELRAQGHPRQAVADKLKISVSTVGRYDNQKPAGRSVPPATVQEIRTLIAQGNSRRQVAALTGVSVTTVRKYDQRPNPKSAATRRRTAAPASRPEQ